MATESPVEEHINVEVSDWWVCLCGNEPDRFGFYSCDRTGAEVEPTEAEWPEPLYVCERCGRIIEQESGLVVGHRTAQAI